MKLHTRSPFRSGIVFACALFSGGCSPAPEFDEADDEAWADTEPLEDSSPGAEDLVDPDAVGANPAVNGTLKQIANSVRLAHEGGRAFFFPRWYCGGIAAYPTAYPTGQDNCPKQLDDDIAGGSSQANPWNHVSINYAGGAPPAGSYVQAGSLNMWIKKKGSNNWIRWTGNNGGKPCRGRVHPYSQPGNGLANSATRCTANHAESGYGQFGWPATTDTHSHNWAGGVVEIGNSRDIDVVLVAGAVRLRGPNTGKYYYNVGADRRNPNQTGALPALTFGRAIQVKQNWRWAFATNVSASRLRQLCQNGRLPDDLPITASCEI